MNNFSEKFPKVSLVLPIRNESEYINKTLKAVERQDYRHDLIEVIIVDGESQDDTKSLVNQWIEEIKTKGFSFSRCILLENKKKIVPVSLNIGIKESLGDIIIRVDGHTVICPDYVRRCVEALIKTGADNVGGLQRAVASGLVAEAITKATSSPFGVGDSKFHYSQTSGLVDTVYLGAYPRDVFNRIGFFDEELMRNQDDEFNFRLKQQGGHIWLDQSIKSFYHCRTTFISLWRQYFQYGLYKVLVIIKRKQALALRHFIPVFFILGLVIACFTQTLLYLVSFYLLCNFLASFLASRKNIHLLPSIILSFMILHLSYGLGFLFGLYKWRNKYFK
ncbi:MAG: glycosyltransferase family 2 protein [Candidatus Omnitrophica bacterium]|nr:glycosyltransferase family 2 protein [Candidatus Omnitrophota bacterium]